LEDVQPYANGSKVMLQFGNFTSGSFANVKAEIDWGSVDEKGNPSSTTQKTKDIELVKSLGPGAWTSEEMILENVPPAALGFVRIHDLTTDHIALRRAR